MTSRLDSDYRSSRDGSISDEEVSGELDSPMGSQQVSEDRDALDPPNDEEASQPISAENVARLSEFTESLRDMCSRFYYQTVIEKQNGRATGTEAKSLGSITAPVQWEVDERPNVLDLIWVEYGQSTDREGEDRDRGYQAIVKFERGNNTTVGSTQASVTNPTVLRDLLFPVEGAKQPAPPAPVTESDFDGLSSFTQVVTPQDGSKAEVSWDRSFDRVRVKMFAPSPTDAVEKSTVGAFSAGAEQTARDEVQIEAK